MGGAKEVRAELTVAGVQEGGKIQAALNDLATLLGVSIDLAETYQASLTA